RPGLETRWTRNHPADGPPEPPVAGPDTRPPVPRAVTAMPVVAPGTGCRRTATAAVPGQFSRALRRASLGMGRGARVPGPRAGAPAFFPLDPYARAESLPGPGEPHSRPPVSG